MDKPTIISFFDRMAPSWDADMIRNDTLINTILDNANVHSGVRVLDVACGTGVLFPDYLSHNVACITAIDFSPAMIAIAESKVAKLGDDAKRFCIICDDVETHAFDTCFDSIIVYNSFPHFPDSEKLICRLSGLLAKDGVLTVAHGMSKEAIDKHHSGIASSVSISLLPAEELAGIFAKYLDVTCCISDDKMYQVVGKKK